MGFVGDGFVVRGGGENTFFRGGARWIKENIFFDPRRNAEGRGGSRRTSFLSAEERGGARRTPFGPRRNAEGRGEHLFYPRRNAEGRGEHLFVHGGHGGSRRASFLSVRGREGGQLGLRRGRRGRGRFGWAGEGTHKGCPYGEWRRARRGAFRLGREGTHEGCPYGCGCGGQATWTPLRFSRALTRAWLPSSPRPICWSVR